MSRLENQKLKLLYLARILLRETDEDHPLPLARLLAALRACGVEVRDRKSVYADLEALRVFGLDVATRREGRSVGYFIAGRDFELPELRLLVDAAQGSRFITRKKTEQLIAKLEKLCSVHQAGALQREVYVAGRVKSMNESVYYSVDTLSAAIAAGEQVRFRYFGWALDDRGRPARALRRDGAVYQVSPWALLWSDDNYYLAAGENGALRHFRADKLLDLAPAGVRRDPPPAGFDPAAYGREVFGMFGGPERVVRLALPEALLGVAVDRFGPDLLLARADGRLVVTAHVAVSPQFLAWVFGLGPEAELLLPPDLRAQMGQQLDETAARYKTDSKLEKL